MGSRQGARSVVCAALAACAVAKASAGELLVNGNFDDILVGWSVPAALDPWLPYQHPQGSVSLEPEGMWDYAGPVLFQPLNVTGVANQTVSAAVALSIEWQTGPGRAVAVYLEYLDQGGVSHRQLLINPLNSEIPTETSANFTGQFTLPADAAKLTGLTVEKQFFGAISADDFSLTSATLTAGAIPRIGSATPSAVAYGDTLTIQGSGLGGATPPKVLLNGSSSGLAVTSWTDERIEVAVSTPAASGLLEVAVSDTYAPQRKQVAITSPHCALALPTNRFWTIAGMPVEVVVKTEFRNGFTAPEGVQFQVANGATPVPVTPVPAVNRPGGSLITIPTNVLAPGNNRLSIRPVGGGFNGADSFFDVFLEVANSGAFILTDTPTTTFTATRQGRQWCTVELRDAAGQPLKTVPTFAWSSTNPAVCDVHPDPMWGDVGLLVNAEGAATIRATSPDGNHYDLSVTVDLPDSPVLTACQVISPVMTNGGDQQNELVVQCNQVMTETSVTYQALDWGDLVWGPDRKSLTWSFTTDPGAPTGTVLITAAASGVSRCVKLQIVNDPAKGLITGRVVNLFGGGGHHMHLAGTLEFYDAAGQKVTPAAGDEDLFIMAFGTDAYQAPYLDPGTYRVRWVPEMGGTPQWWPNASSFAEAGEVTITAGGTIPAIHFFLDQPPVEAPQPVGQPTYDAGSGTFSMAVQTVEGVSYQLQRSNTMADGTWFNVGETIWGDGKDQTLQDETAEAGNGFYRVLAKPSAH